MAGGAKGVTLPTVQEQRAVFEDALIDATTAVVDSEEMQLRRALGVA